MFEFLDVAEHVVGVAAGIGVGGGVVHAEKSEIDIFKDFAIAKTQN